MVPEHPQTRPALTRITAHGSLPKSVAELWRWRSLFVELVARDLAVRYRQTALGVAWSVLRPALTAILLTMVFQRIAGLSPDAGLPYPVLVLCALVPWQFVAAALGEASTSLVANAPLVTRVYVPRMLIPGAAIAVAAVDGLLSLAVLAAAMAWYGVAPPAHAVLALVPMLLAGLLATGLGLLLAALLVRWRDVRHALPFALQVWLLASPVGFPSSAVPAAWRWAWDLNPMTGLVEGMRWALLPGVECPLRALAASAAWALFLALAGIVVFRRAERSFADQL